MFYRVEVKLKNTPGPWYGPCRAPWIETDWSDSTLGGRFSRLLNEHFMFPTSPNSLYADECRFGFNDEGWQEAEDEIWELIAEFSQWYDFRIRFVDEAKIAPFDHMLIEWKEHVLQVIAHHHIWDKYGEVV